MNRPIRPKERETIIQSLKSGVVPRTGLQHIQVGRSEELKSFVKDVDTIAEGGTSFRFVIGEYGSGKTFFLSLLRTIALEKGLVTMHADLSPIKRFHGSDGQPRLLLSEMVENLSTRTKPDGNALQNILERFISNAREEAKANGSNPYDLISEKLNELNDYTGGYNFVSVIKKYLEGYESGNQFLMNSALKWLKAGYTTKTDTLRDLGIREFISDSSFYNTLKLYSVLVRKAGYKGLLICVDEMVNLYKIPNSISRKANYEEILSMLNNTLQGSFSNIGFIMGGTPEFLTDNIRGLYSYEALKSRLSENSFSKQLGVTDYNSVVLRLASLTKEELYLLLTNLRHVFASGNEEKYLVPDEALLAFLQHCSNKIGESYFRTPRTTIKSFLDLLSILEQYPNYKWSDMISSMEVQKDVEPSQVSNMVVPSLMDTTLEVPHVRNVAGTAPQKSSADDAFANFSL
jgi:hypothetical protein